MDVDSILATDAQVSSWRVSAAIAVKVVLTFGF